MLDREALPVLLGPLRPLLLGQDALAIERLWDLPQQRLANCNSLPIPPDSPGGGPKGRP